MKEKEISVENGAGEREEAEETCYRIELQVGGVSVV
jgi:hypothetical protein